MKITKIFSGLYICLSVMFAGSVLTSCEDQPDAFELTDGVPTINYIRMPYLAQADSLITEASLQNVICLVGNNLTSIRELYFNDCKAMLNTSYITNHTLIVEIPESIPVDVTDKIYMVTKNGQTVDYDFHVVVPAPLLAAMSCEYAKAGEEVTISGNYFVDDPVSPLKVTLPDGQEITEFKSISQGAVSFEMPECDTEGTLIVETIYGKTESAFHYLDSRGMMFDFDTPNPVSNVVLGNHGWHPRDILSDETSLSGNFLQMGNGIATMSEDGGWDDSNFSFEYWAGSWDDPQNVTSGDGIALHNLIDFTDWENMSLKFEMCIPASNPWSAGAMQICFEGYDRVTYSGNSIAGYSGTVMAPNAKVFNGEDGMGVYGRAMYRPWVENGSYDTKGKWVTVTIPLKDFVYNREGKAAEVTPNKPGDFASLTMFVVAGGINGKECTPIFKIDNIRAVPNK